MHVSRYVSSAKSAMFCLMPLILAALFFSLAQYAAVVSDRTSPLRAGIMLAYDTMLA